MKSSKTPDLATPGGRLRSERLRLRLSQAEMAAIGGVEKSWVVAWEASTGSRSAAMMTALAGAGLDVLFVVTGKTTPETLAGVTIREAMALLPPADRHRLILNLLEAELRK